MQTKTKTLFSGNTAHSK